MLKYFEKHLSAKSETNAIILCNQERTCLIPVLEKGEKIFLANTPSIFELLYPPKPFSFRPYV